MAESLEMTHDEDRNMINLQHTWVVAPGTFGFCPGGTNHRSRDRRTVGSLEVF